MAFELCIVPRMNANRKKIRLYVPDVLSPGAQLTLSVPQSHYAAQVMRLGEGDALLLFNGTDGEWLASITRQDKKHVHLLLQKQLRGQEASPDLWLVFAPIKGKTDMVIEKAVELGVSRIIPAITNRTIVRSLNMEKMQAHAIEAAEQCERLDVPHLETPRDLTDILGNWSGRELLYADETGGGVPIGSLLSTMAHTPKALLIGPEGGFTPEEQKILKQQAFIKPFGMGARILRADTAAIAALACIQAWCGDWDKKPAFGA